jgi:hypothetical protein
MRWRHGRSSSVLRESHSVAVQLHMELIDTEMCKLALS